MDDTHDLQPAQSGMTGSWFGRLQPGEQLYEQMFRLHPAVMLLIDPASGTIVDANLAASHFYGYPLESLRGMSIRQINPLSPEESPLEPGYSTGGPRSYFGFQHRLASGDWREVEEYTTPVQTGGQTLVYSIVYDVTERKQAEEDLRQSEAHYRLLAENIADVIWKLDLTGRFTYVSPSVEKLRGFTAQEVLAQTADQALTPASLQQIQNAILELMLLMSDGEIDTAPAFYELEQPRKDGSTVWTEALVRSLFDGQRQLQGFLGVSRDISERKKIEDVQMFLLKCGSQGEDFFQALARYLAETLEMDYVSISRLHPGGESAEPLAVFCDGRFEAGQSFALQDTPFGETVGKAVCRYLRSVRSAFPSAALLEKLTAESYVGATLWNATGQPIGLIAVIGRRRLEIARLTESVLKAAAVRAGGELERRQAEQALREKSEEVDQFFSRALDLLCIADREGHFLYLNQEWENVLGYPLQELTGRRYIELVHPDDQADTLAVAARLQAGPDSLDFTNRYRCRDGSYRWIEWRALPLGERIYATARDITERRRIEEELHRLNAYLEWLVRDTYPRVKNNLMVVESLLLLQASSARDPAVREMFTESRTRMKTMLLIHEKLHYSRDLTQVEFASYLRDLIHDLFHTYRPPSIPVELHTEIQDVLLPAETATVCGLIVNELISNALKHAFKGRQQGKLWVSLSRDENGYLLVVGDDGAGLPPGLDYRNTPSLGMQIVTLETAQLNGRLELDQTAGTAWKITFAG
jgi:PAS domain S-box-containing protein